MAGFAAVLGKAVPGRPGRLVVGRDVGCRGTVISPLPADSAPTTSSPAWSG